MKFGFRKPSFTKRIAARNSVNRIVKNSLRFLSFVYVMFLLSCSPSHEKEASTRQLGVEGNTIRRVDYGADWPFTVDEAVLKCVSNQVILVVKDKTYALNGTAKNFASTYGYVNVEEIWAYDSSMMRKLADAGFSKEQIEKVKTRVSISKVISDGLQLCE